jgi:hypothetical protein
MIKIALLGTLIALNWFGSLVSVEKPSVTVSLTIDNNTDRNFILHNKDVKLKIPAKKSAIKATIPLILPVEQIPGWGPYFGKRANLILTDTKLNKDFQLSLQQLSWVVENDVMNWFTVALNPIELNVSTKPYKTPDLPSAIGYKVHLALDGDNLEKSTFEIIAGSLK